MATRLTNSLASRIFAVTGGASGMGAATVRRLAQQGAAAIWIGDWNTTNFTSITQEVKNINSSTKVFTHQLDVSNSQAVDSWVSNIVKESGGLHGAANLAGVPQGLPRGDAVGKAPTLTLQSDSDWDRIMSVNLNGLFYSTRAQVRAMAEMPKNSGPSIVNVASLASISHFPGVFAYSTSKAGVAHFSIQVAKDVKPFGIRCNAVSPGNILTPMSAVFAGGEERLKEQSQPGGLFANAIDPAEVAKVIVWLLSDEASHVNGVNLLVGDETP